MSAGCHKNNVNIYMKSTTRSQKQNSNNHYENKNQKVYVKKYKWSVFKQLHVLAKLFINAWSPIIEILTATYAALNVKVIVTGGV